MCIRDRYHSMLLSDKGEAYVLGSTRFRDLTSELLSREITDCVVPKRINLPVKGKVVEIATGNNHTLFLTGILLLTAIENNELYGIGANESGQLDGQQIHYREVESIPRKISIRVEGKIARVKAGNVSSYVFTDKGEVWYWGNNLYQHEKSKDVPFKLLNEEVKDITSRGEKIIDFDMGYYHSVLLTETAQCLHLL
eukprot:TRINITY_DN2638_c0_g4_i4.p1 TRINITY_DN2638_c0_g4~~TRINITY_DN2638_c0_g4_i4.p1  ORF type:complete len:196 (+),score=28.17 TRINITY_DN2638_c0_g4_i4:71-658(+)